METETKLEVMIGLWQTSRKDFFISHKDGLSKEQVELLQGLKVGDRLKMWASKESAVVTRPNFRIGYLEERNTPKN